MPSFKISSSTTNPAISLPSATTSGVAPLEATSFTDSSRPPGICPFCSRTKRITASGAPLRIARPPGTSMPLMRVCALNATNSLLAGAIGGPPAWSTSSASFTIDLPSGVSSATEANAANRAR